MEGAEPTVPRRQPAHRLVRVLGAVVAVLAIALCVRAVAGAWPEVRYRVAHARPGFVIAALLCSAASMAVLGLTWWRCLRTFGIAARPAQAVAWHFAGELGKYVPGGVWTVLGRGELARRGGGIPRTTGYATTLITYAITCVAAASVGGALAGVAAARDSAFAWGWALVAAVPLSLVAVHPALVAAALRAGHRLSGRRVDLTPPPTPRLLELVAWSAPAWLLLGGAASLVTEALGVGQEPFRVAFAAAAAWLVGFLAVPVPAGVGVREVVFVVACGLPAGPAAAVAAITRALLVIVDAAGGFTALAYVGRRRRVR